ncbi:MAG: YkgJ family cysteine cluster protein [Candidatus Hermodarchaeota archaeon]
MKKLRFICTRCGNCCTDKNTLVNLTYFDILRIKKGLNLELNEILEIVGFYISNNEFTSQDQEKMILTPIITEKGLAFIALLKNSLGGCYFYDSTKKTCLIYDLRPMFCRTFPFSFKLIDESDNKKNGELVIFYTKKGEEYCPGIGNKSPIIDENSWINLGIKTLEYLKLNHKFNTEWNKQVKRKKVKPTAKEYLLRIIKIDDI